MKNLRNAFPDRGRSRLNISTRETDTTTMTTATTKTTTTENLLWIEAVRRTGSGYFLTSDSAAYVQRSFSFLSFRSRYALAGERETGQAEPRRERRKDMEKGREKERDPRRRSAKKVHTRCLAHWYATGRICGPRRGEQYDQPVRHQRVNYPVSTSL